jgi:dihydroxyacid dehydratase/phosphogluconate dehydratase
MMPYLFHNLKYNFEIHKPQNQKMTKKKLRSSDWFGRTGKDGFIYRSWMKNQGIPAHEFKGKPVIGICNTWSELTQCSFQGTGRIC